MTTRLGTVRSLVACLALLLALPALAQTRADDGGTTGLWRHQIMQTIRLLRADRGGDLRFAHKAQSAVEKGSRSRLMSLSGAISGQVRFEGGSDRASVLAFSTDSTRQELYSADVGDDGSYVISGLQAGSYYLLVQAQQHIAEFYDDATEFDDATPVTVRDGEVTSGINFTLSAVPTGTGVIEGRLTDATTGEGIGQAMIVAFDEANPYSMGWGVVETDGTYRIPDLPDGNYFVEAEAMGYLPEWYNNVSTMDSASSVSVQNNGTVSGINFALERGGMISGRVVDQNGDPVEGVAIQAIPAENRESDTLWSGGTFGYGFTGADGRYTVSGLVTGDYLVGASFFNSWFYTEQWYDGAETFDDADEVHVTYPNTTSGIDFELMIVDADGVISGVITDTSGTPLAGAYVAVESPYDGSTFPVAASAMTDSAGRYTVENLPDGDYYVSAAGGFGRQFVQVWWRSALTPDDADLVPLVNGVTTPSSIDIALPLVVGTGSISGTVLLGDGSAAPYAQVDAIVVDASDSSVWFVATAMAAPDGSYRIEQLPAGTYLLHATVFTDDGVGEAWYDGATSPFDADPVALADGQSRTGIDFRIDATPRYGTMVGQITDATSGAPVRHAYVELSYESSSSGAYMDYPVYALTDEFGRYQINRVPAGTHVLVVVIPGGIAYSGSTTDYDQAERVEVMGGDTVTVNVRIAAESHGSGSISGTVSSDNGAAVDPAVLLAIPSLDGETFFPGLTDTDGTYVIPGLPDGRYYVLCYSPEHIEEFYRDAWDPSEAELVTVSNGAAVTGIDFGLEAMRILPDYGGEPTPGAKSTIVGTVTDQYGQPVHSGTVYLLDGSNEALASARTRSDGSYEIAGVPPGTTYRMLASSVGYTSEYNNGAASFEAAQPIRVSGGRIEVDFTLDARTTSVDDDRSGVSSTMTRPNPFSTETAISFSLDRLSNVRVAIVNPRGELVRELHRGASQAGTHELRWDGRASDGTEVGSGLYFVRIETGTGVRTSAVTLVR